MTNTQDGALLESALVEWQIAQESGRVLQAADLLPGRPDLVHLFQARLAALLKFESLVVLNTDAVGESKSQTSFSSHTHKEVEAGLSKPLQVPGFEIGVELGRGGMGVVYLANQLQINRLVALKLVSTANELQTIHRFHVEVELAAAVRHPNVVEVFQYGEHFGKPFLILEYCPGGKLSDWTRKQEPVEPRKAVRLLADVAAGVGAAHSKGIVHRDLKPDNVLFTADGTPKVTDFGLAKLGMGSDLTPTNIALGTPAYMSPEQAGGGTKFLGPEADVWALGVILYELLAGRKPFPGSSNRDYVVQILAREMTPLRQLCPGVPRDLALIVEKCLRQEPHERYGNASELAADLQNWLVGLPITARPVGVIVSTWKWARRHKTASALIALFLIVAIGLPVYIVRNELLLEAAERDSITSRLLQEQAEKRATEKEAYRTLTSIRQRAVDRYPGWVEQTRRDIHRLLDTEQLDPEIRNTLRDEALVAGLAYDVQQSATWKSPLMVLPLASSPDGKYVALGQYVVQTGEPGTIPLIDPKTGTEVRRFSYKTQTSLNAQGKREEKDGNNAVAFSPDSKSLFATTRSGRILRYDIAAGTVEPTLDIPALNCRPWALCISGDGKLIHAADLNQVGTWDATTGERKALQVLSEECHTLVPNPLESELLIEQSSGTLLRRQPITLGLLGFGRQSHHDSFGRLGGFAAGQRALVSYHRESRLLCLNDPSFLPALFDRSYCVDPLLKSGSDFAHISRMACHPTLPLIATVNDTSSARSMKIWDLARREPAARITMPPGTDIYPTWTNPEHNQLLASTGEEMHSWRVTSPVFEKTTAVVPYPLHYATFGPGRAVTTLEKPNTRAPSWRLWIDDLSAGVGRCEFLPWPRNWNNADPASEVHWYPDGKRVGITLVGIGCRILNTTNSPFVDEYGMPEWTQFRLTADGTKWFHVQKDNYNFDAVVLHRATGGYGELRRWPETVPHRVILKSGITQLAVGNRRALVGGADGEIFILDDTGLPISQLAAPRRDNFLASAVATDDTVGAICSQSGIVRLFDLSKPGLREVSLPIKHVNGATAVAFSPDCARIATGGKDNTVRLWQRVSGSDNLQYKLLVSIPHLPISCRRLQFGDNADTLLVLLEDEHAARIWDLKKMNAYLAEFGLGW